MEWQPAPNLSFRPPREGPQPYGLEVSVAAKLVPDDLDTRTAVLMAGATALDRYHLAQLAATGVAAAFADLVRLHQPNTKGSGSCAGDGGGDAFRGRPARPGGTPALRSARISR